MQSLGPVRPGVMWPSTIGSVCAAWGGVTIKHWVLLHPKRGHNTNINMDMCVCLDDWNQHCSKVMASTTHNHHHHHHHHHHCRHNNIRTPRGPMGVSPPRWQQPQQQHNALCGPMGVHQRNQQHQDWQSDFQTATTTSKLAELLPTNTATTMRWKCLYQ